MTYCLNGVCIHLKLLTFELCCNVCLFTPVVFILEVFLVIVIRLHFSLKDDEENNQIILDLAVYRSDFFPPNFCHSQNVIQCFNYTALLWGLFKRKTNNIVDNRTNLEACAKEVKLNKPKALQLFC